MTDTEICDKIFKLRRARTDKIIEVMKDYDKDMRKQIMALQDQCTHSQTRPYENFMGDICGRECKFCGKVIFDEKE